MAAGRDLSKRSPRWLNCFVCASGLTTATCFLWRVVLSNSEASAFPLGIGSLLSRIMVCAIAPLLLLATILGRNTRKWAEM